MKQQQDEKVQALIDRLDAGYRELLDSNEWAAMLRTAARFHQYSLGNVLLIMAQRRDATRVAGYRAWQSMKRQVRKGERGIQILAPVTRKLTVENEDGEEETIRRLAGFRVEHVWDIAQTDGEPLADDVMPELLEGEAPDGLWDALAAQVAGAGFRLDFGDTGRANGLTDFLRHAVTISPRLDPAAAVKTLAHELAHVLIGPRPGQRQQAEVEAESVAYIVVTAAGLDTSRYSVPYVGHWGDGNPEAVKEAADRVLVTARRILRDIESEAHIVREAAA